jgi:hypothetical protein
VTRYTYAQLVELVGGDQELIARCVEEGVIVRRDDHRVIVDIDRVLVVRTLWRELEIEWPGIEVILRMRDELVEARERIAALEEQVRLRTPGKTEG